MTDETAPHVGHDEDDQGLDAFTLEALLAGETPQVSAELSPAVTALSALLSAAAAPGTPAELSGESAAVAAFVEAPPALGSSRARRVAGLALPAAIGSKLALGLAAGAVSIGGLTAAAFTGSLPDPAQALAHRTIGAPAAHSHGTPSAEPTATPTPVGPDATGSAAYGLCTAWSAEKSHGKAADHSIAFRNLATAAGGADKVDAYCATVTKPGATPSSADHPTGKPTGHPTGGPAAHPSDHPTGSPSDHPKAPEPIPSHR